MNKYAKAYTEVYEILSYLKKEDYDKIPEEIINVVNKITEEVLKYQNKNDTPQRYADLPFIYPRDKLI